MRTLVLVLALAAAVSPAETDSTRYGSADALARYARGRLLEERGEWDKALSEYFRAVTLDPRAVAPVQRASELLARQGHQDRSLEFAERALGIDPDDARSLWLKGAALYNLGLPAEALGILTRAAERDPGRVEYWKSLIRVAELQNDYELLARACREATALDEEDDETWFQLARVEARLGHFGAADSALRVVRASHPERPGLEFLGAWIDEGLERDTQAIEGYLRHLQAFPGDVATRQRVVALLGQHERWNEALPHARLVTQARPGDPEALETEADLAFKCGRAAEARERIERLQRLDPADPELTARAVLVLARNGHAAEGVAMAGHWSRQHPGDFRGPLLEARAQALAGSFDRALERARAAVNAAPDSLAPRIALGRVAQQGKQWDVAAEAWRSVLERLPRNVGATLDMAFCLEQKGDLEGAVVAARDALAWAPENPTVLNFVGYLLADHDRDLEEARQLIEKALQSDPDNGAFIDSLGWVYFRLGRLAEARTQLERAALLTRGDAVVLEHLGDVYRDLRLPEMARDQYRKSLAADSSNQRVRNKLEALR